MTKTLLRPALERGSGYLPSLDGWRAIAVLGVMMTHDRPWMLFGHSSIRYKGYGGYGVYIFFAISGFLITSRILEEERICGYFDIRRFYIRRIFRIQPAAWAYLAAVALVMALGYAHQYGVFETRSSWNAALLLYTNYVFRSWKSPTLTGHFWTLAVEEHFYILLSVTLFFAKRYRIAVLVLLFLMFMVVPSMNRFHVYDVKPRSTQWQLTSLLLSALVAVGGWRAWVGSTLGRSSSLRFSSPPWSGLRTLTTVSATPYNCC